MRKNILSFLLLGLFSLINSQIFNEPYYFIGPDEMHVYKQSHDTLYVSTTFSLELFNTKKYKSHYKIWEAIDKPTDFIAMKLESLDSIPLTTNPFPEDRFKISIYKRENEKEMRLVNEITHLTKEEMANYNIKVIQFKNNFGMSIYSASRMKELLKLKKVVNKKDVNKIDNELNKSKYLKLAEDYKKQNQLLDPYASILTATLVNTACLNLGYSPIGARFSMNIINSNKKPEEKQKIINEFYKRVNP